MISSHKSKKRSPLQAYQFLPNKQIMFCAFLILLLLYSNQNDSHVSVHLFTIYLHAYMQTKRKNGADSEGIVGLFFLWLILEKISLVCRSYCGVHIRLFGVFLLLSKYKQYWNYSYIVYQVPGGMKSSRSVWWNRALEVAKTIEVAEVNGL